MNEAKASSEKAPGEILSGKLNELIVHETRRKDGSLRVQYNYSLCPSLAEQHTAHLSDLNYLIATYRPDELEAYIQARGQYRREILGHDFSAEPSLTDAKNIAYRLRMDFEELSDDVKSHFKNHVEFLKFIDNPANQEKMLKLGLMTKKEIAKHTGDTPKLAEEKPSTSDPKPSSSSPS